MKINEILNGMEKYLNKNAPTILSVMAGVGVITTAVMAAKGGLAAQKYIEEHEDLTKKEKILQTAEYYIPAVISGGLTIFAIAMSNHVNHRRILALTGALAVTNDKFTEYQNKVKTLLGEKTHTKTVDAINEDKVSKIDSTKAVVVGQGTMLCMDSVTGQLFYSDVNTIDAAVNKANKELMISGWYSFDSFLDDATKGTYTRSKMGEIMGWNDSDGIDISYTSCLTKDMRPCLVVNYVNLPVQIPWN